MPPTFRVALAPGLELLKLIVVLTEAPGARLPRLCGNGVPLVAPSFAVVNITLLAVTAPMFWSVTAATTVDAFARLSDEVTMTLVPPHGEVHTGVAVVMPKDQPPDIDPPSPVAKSNT